MRRLTNHEISDMNGREALPRRSGELVFHEEWERRAFAVAVALCEAGHYTWDAFRQQLVDSIADVENMSNIDEEELPGYYEHWLDALEKILAEIGMISSAQRTS